jgi:peptide deformylase
LPLYLRSLVEMTEQGMETVSSDGLADAAGVNSAKVRKDLSYLGSYGTRGVGYDVEYLIYQISRELGLTQDWNCVIVGVGNLGRALAGYRGFGERGFRIVAAVDIDASKVGHKLDSLSIEDFDDNRRLEVQRMGTLMDDSMGIGLAAPQLGVPTRLLVYRIGDGAPLAALVNPEREWASKETEIFEEGCLSLPAVHVDVERSIHVRVRALELASIPSSQLAAMKLVVNHAYEQMGMSSTQTLGPILDGLMRNTPDARRFIDIAERDGVGTVVRERDGGFGDYSQAPPDLQPDPRNVITP